MATKYAPRIRAARGYAGLSQADLANALGVEVQWVKRREAGQQAPKPADRAAIANATNVPLDFLEHGFAPAGEPGLAEKVERLEHQMRTVLDIISIRGATVAETPPERSEAPSSG